MLEQKLVFWFADVNVFLTQSLKSITNNENM